LERKEMGKPRKTYEEKKQKMADVVAAAQADADAKWPNTFKVEVVGNQIRGSYLRDVQRPS
jgi:hypothetical protein